MPLFRASITTFAHGSKAVRVAAQEPVWIEASVPSEAKFHAGHILRGCLLANSITYVHPNGTDESLAREAAKLVLTLEEVSISTQGLVTVRHGSARVIPNGVKRRNLNRPKRFKNMHNGDAAFEEWKKEHWSHLPEERVNKVEWHS